MSLTEWERIQGTHPVGQQRQVGDAGQSRRSLRIGRTGHQEVMIRPVGEQLRIQIQAHAAETHLNDRLIQGLERLLNHTWQRPRAAADQVKPLFRQSPIHGEIKGTAQQQLPAPIRLQSTLRHQLKRSAEGAIDLVPAEIAHPHQRGINGCSQLCCSGGNVPQNQHRSPLRTDPARLRLHLLRQSSIQLSQSDQRGGRVGAESIRLDHPDIPAAGSLFDVLIPQQQRQKPRTDQRTHHQTPVGTKSAQLLQHSRIPGRMAKAMAAAADVNQHARGS